jgi:hypothetical protein
MKRFRRWLFNGLAVLSWLLCVAMGLIWARSYFAVNDWPANWVGGTSENYTRIQWAGGNREIESRDGRLSLTLIDLVHSVHQPTAMKDFHHEFIGFGGDRLGNGRWGSGTVWTWEYFTTLWMPHWFLVLITALLPAMWIVVDIRSRKVPRLKPQSHCRECGYDLRATPDRCPECGTIPAKMEVNSTTP